ncbi:recombinase RecF [Photorhabdus luminescens subsp. luminescens]|uniref:Predicted ATP-binding protein involved in virulence n=1 Tax=Photorhabdus luminescens TaxID=29488 RepID=A0A1G5R8N2_PHOLU|nr:retron Ec78 anti-phage system effector ATPase PtuA [Photorhabdus luminescens]KMW73210.1 recombinase RecF [Photorhabdus luminescens subsp. luminescens]SCZ69751.1 Predicted ATP-binding protein involved in virulence [Photorhabdus luminescens]
MTRQLERKAKGGNLLSAFELYQRSLQVERELDEKQADEWLELCWDYLQGGYIDSSETFRPTNPLFLRQLDLSDFRRFSHLKVNLEKDLTVIIGNNGKGKTSILSAIAKSLSWFSANILKEDGSGQRLSEFTDIRNDSVNKYADITTNFFFGKGLKSLALRLSRSALGVSERRDSRIKPAKDLADVWRVVNEARTINLPTFALYTVERSHPFTKFQKDSNERREDRFDAYNHSLTGAGRFDHFIEWYVYLHKRTAGDVSSSIETLRQQVCDLQKSVDNGMVSVAPLLEDMKSKLESATAKYNLALSKRLLAESLQKKIVEQAITLVVPSISHIWVETESGIDVVKVTNDGQDVTIEQLSDGQRVFLGLIADLARRMVMLNPLLKNPLEGSGIVLIDEIELHLHPKWQQDVITDLQKVFPNIQFIITTHSPIVLSTIERRCIREFADIDESGMQFLQLPQMQTKGSENVHILEQVMGVFSTPPRIKESHWVGNFEQSLIADGEEISVQTRTLYDNIKKHFGNDSPELKKADSLIRVHQMKNKINKLKSEKDKQG